MRASSALKKVSRLGGSPGSVPIAVACRRLWARKRSSSRITGLPNHSRKSRSRSRALPGSLGKTTVRSSRKMSSHFFDLHRAVVDESHRFRSDVPGGQDLSNGFGLRSPICHDRKKSILLDQQVRAGESVLDQCRVVLACNGKQHPALRKRFEQLLIQATDLTPPESSVKEEETPGAPASPRMPCQSVPSKSVIKPFRGGGGAS